MFIVMSNTKFDSQEELLETYRNQNQWTQKHTDLIVKGIEQLVPGQRLELSGDNFRISGRDEDGDWSYSLNYPRVIQKMDSYMQALLDTRVMLGAQLHDMNMRVDELIKERDRVMTMYGKSEGAMHKYANSVKAQIKFLMP